MAQERMPQVQLPVFPDGVTHITSEIAFERREGKVCYFNGHVPVFIHECEDSAFRLFSSQLVINGNATQSEISRAFGVPLVTVKRYVKLYRAGGPRAFFAAPSRRRGSKLTPELLVEAQGLLDEGLELEQATTVCPTNSPIIFARVPFVIYLSSLQSSPSNEGVIAL